LKKVEEYLVGLDHGQFQQEQRGRNPQTGKTIQIAAKK
jgi:nucleoid DNA-binding protein